MKIAHGSRSSEKEALKDLLINYRDTPHPATGVPPAAMLFRDGTKSAFPRRSISAKRVEEALTRDKVTKQERQQKINASKYRIPSDFQIGDGVMLRNYKRASKFDPLFLPEVCAEVDRSDCGRFLTVKRESDGKIFKRHPDDIKGFCGLTDEVADKSVMTEETKPRCGINGSNGVNPRRMQVMKEEIRI